MKENIMNTRIEDTHDRSPANPPKRPQISVYIATSIDGFIAKENDELDWWL